MLRVALVANGPDPIKARLAALIGVMPSPSTDSSDAEVKIAIYQVALSDLPAWAVIEACDMALRGKVGNTGGRFLPAPGEIHAAAERLVGLILAEKLAITKILTARVESAEQTDEDRQASIDRVRALAAEVRRSAAAIPPHELARMKASKGDRWDEMAAARDRDRLNRLRPIEQTRAEAVEALAAMTYASSPITLSDEALATMGRVRPKQEAE